MSDDGREALVVIAFLGCVFSPRYVRARRRGHCDPLAYAALNAAFHGPGSHRWAFTEYADAATAHDAQQLRMGANRLSWNDEVLHIEIDEREAPLPRALRARIAVHPTTRSDLAWPLVGSGAHWWYPLIPRARVSVDLRPNGPCWQGSGYLDCNRGTGALEGAFTGWQWLRAHGPTSTSVVYETEPAAHLAEHPARSLFLLSDGGTRIGLPPPARPLAPTRWGISRNVSCDDNQVPRLLRTLEDTPFYARSLVTTRLQGEQLTAVHESLSLRRFQSGWVRSLLPFRMRRSRPDSRDNARNS